MSQWAMSGPWQSRRTTMPHLRADSTCAELVARPPVTGGKRRSTPPGYGSVHKGQSTVERGNVTMINPQDASLVTDPRTEEVAEFIGATPTEVVEMAEGSVTRGEAANTGDAIQQADD